MKNDAPEPTKRTHAVITPWPLSSFPHTWCGQSLDHGLGAGDYIGAVPELVDCPECIRSMERAFAFLGRWLPFLQPTKGQLELLRHACGMDGGTPFYRNYFAASPDSDDDRAWAEMVRLGWADVRREPDSPFPYRFYGVTDRGKAFLLPRRPACEGTGRDARGRVDLPDCEACGGSDELQEQQPTDEGKMEQYSEEEWHVVTAWAQNCTVSGEGSGWSNQVVWVLLQQCATLDGTPNFKVVGVQPKHFNPQVRALFDVSEVVAGSLKDAIEPVIRGKVEDGDRT